MQTLRTLAILSTAPLLLTACGGGGSSSGGAPEGLEPPSQLTLVEPIEDPGTGMTSNSGHNFPPESDFESDVAVVRVYDPAVRPLQNVNEILCFMGLTGAGLLVNEGAFLAQIDPSLCEEGEDEGSLGSEDGQSTGATEFELWTVESTRASGSAPQFSSIWVPDRSADNPVDEEIRVRVRVDEGVSDDNPFGSWEMDFAGVDLAAPDVQNPEFLGTLETVDAGSGEIGFTFYEENGDVTVPANPGDFAGRLQVHVRAAEDQTSGYARIVETQRFHDGMSDSGQLTTEYLVAFDETHFLRSIDGGAETLYSREQFDERVWQYNLYYATGELAGQRVERDGGFGFRTDDGVYGYAGYYGVWLPDGVELDSGDTVFRDVYDEPSELVEYTVTRGGGKLVKFSREDIALDDVQGDSFQWWEFDSMGGVQQYLVSWDGANWVRTHSVDPNTYELTELDPPTVIDTMLFPYLSLYSDSLGGPASWMIDEPLVVTYFAQEFEDADSDLFANGENVTLYGFVSCLRGEITGAEAEAGDVYLEDAPDGMTPYVYSFQQSTLTLFHDVNGDGSVLERAGLADGEEPNSGPFTWGMQSGPLVTDTTGIDDVWDVWTLPEFWQYETGHNDWNVLWSLADGQSNVVDFEPPLQFSYTHATANDRNEDASNDGKTYFLSYDGPGQLHGLPYVGVDLDGDMNDDRFYPVLSLDDGVMVGPTGTEYVVKATEIEQVLTADPGGNPGLDLTEASDLTVPTVAGYQAPTIGAAPTVTDPPRVINGELVGDAD